MKKKHNVMFEFKKKTRKKKKIGFYINSFISLPQTIPKWMLEKLVLWYNGDKLNAITTEEKISLSFIFRPFVGKTFDIFLYIKRKY